MTRNMLRRKSLSLEKSPGERLASGRRERRSSVAVPIIPPVDLNVKERRGSIVQRWLRHISDAADAYKNRNGRGRQETGSSGPILPAESETPDDAIDRTKDHDESGERVKPDELDSTQEHDRSQDASPASSQTPTLTAGPEAADQRARKSVESSPSQRRITDPLRLTTVENQLINPNEIVVSHNPVLTAYPVFTPLEQLRLQDTAIKRALLEKQQLVADILHVPREDFVTIAELAGEPGGEKEAAELVLAAIWQANQLTDALNDALRVTEEDAVSASAEVTPGCSPRGRRRVRLPGLPVQRVQGIANALNSHLTQLLEIVKDREDERERLRRELQRSREQIHALHEAQRKQASACASCGRSDEAIDSRPLVEDSFDPAITKVEDDENYSGAGDIDGTHQDQKGDIVDRGDEKGDDPPIAADEPKADTAPEVFAEAASGDGHEEDTADTAVPAATVGATRETVAEGGT